MASILNASLSSGLVATGDTSGIIQLQSNGTQTVNVATNGIITNTFNSAAGIVPGYQYYALNSGYAGTQATTAQSLLGVGVTLASSTILLALSIILFCLASFLERLAQPKDPKIKKLMIIKTHILDLMLLLPSYL